MDRCFKSHERSKNFKQFDVRQQQQHYSLDYWYGTNGKKLDHSGWNWSTITYAGLLQSLAILVHTLLLLYAHWNGALGYQSTRHATHNVVRVPAVPMSMESAVCTAADAVLWEASGVICYGVCTYHSSPPACCFIDSEMGRGKEGNSWST